jgi:hypothetical protein
MYIRLQTPTLARKITLQYSRNPKKGGRDDEQTFQAPATSQMVPSSLSKAISGFESNTTVLYISLALIGSVLGYSHIVKVNKSLVKIFDCGLFDCDSILR